MKKLLTKQELIEFEEQLIKEFEQGKMRCPIHLNGGNEDFLLSLFKHIDEKDWVFSTHRNHYHYLLKGGDRRKLILEIRGSKLGICGGQGRSMNVIDPSINFYSSAIVSGNCALAVGVGLALKKKKSKAKVWCFVGDGAEDSGHFMEAVRFALSRVLPVTFIIEDNDYSTDSTKEDRWHNYQPVMSRNIIRYNYKRKFPHVGIGKHVTF